jgi:hypothetical protein
MHFNYKTILLNTLYIFSMFLLSACGGGGGSETGNYTVGGSTSGLTGSLVLQNNGTDNLPISTDGSFTFITLVASGSAYDVTAFSQPTGQTCTVSNGSGSVLNDVTNVTVACYWNSYSLHVNVSGLNGTVKLQNNGGDDLAITSSGASTVSTFATQLANGSNYSVSVLTQPEGQTCSVANGSGTIASASVFNVNLTCINNTYSISIEHAAEPSLNISGTAYILAMSALITDQNSNPAPQGTAVSLRVWPTSWSTGTNCTVDAETATTGTFLNEDSNENLTLEPGEDGTRVNSLGTQPGGTINNFATPSASASGALPSEVYTDANGRANFNLTYPISSALWITNRIRASSPIYGSPAGETVFRLAPLTTDVSPTCFLPPSPYSF